MATQAASLNIHTIRDSVAERVPSYMVPSLFIAVEGFPLMPSGKMDRRRVVQWLEDMDRQTYVRISTSESESKEEGSAADVQLQTVFAKVLNLPVEDVSLNMSFLHLGGDSISAMQVASALRSQGLNNITVQDIIRSKSIVQLAKKAAVRQDDAATVTRNETYDRPFDLSPMQKFFFQCVGDEFNHFNQSVVLQLGRRFEAREIEKAVEAVVAIHPMLRARFKKNESKLWCQEIAAKSSFRFRTHKVKSRAPEAFQATVNESQAALDVTDGPIFAVDVFDVAGGLTQVLSLVAHHLIVDVVAWGIILLDLQNLLNGIAPPPQSLSFPAWQQQQAEQARQEPGNKVLPMVDIPTADFDYWGMSGKPNFQEDVVSESIDLSPKDSMLLLGAQAALATEPLDVLLAAVLESFRKSFPGRPTPPIFNEGHGRETFQSSQDLSRTVGWFTTLCPIHLPVPPDEATDIVSTIRWVRDLRERIADKGRPYFAHRMLSIEGQERFAGHWPAEIVFNYLGRSLERKDSLLQMIENTSSDIGPRVPRFSLFEITAAVSQGSIQLSFLFNRHMQRQPEIRRWVHECRQTLINAVDQLLQLRPEPTLSEFKLLPLTYNGMSKLTTMLPSNITLNEIEDIYPASPMQNGILLSQMKNPGHYAYHCIMEIRCTDGRPVNQARLAEAWGVFVARHPAFRTVFVESLSKTGLVDQIVLKDAAPRVLFVECGDEETQETLRQQKPVDYREFAPPHRLTICKTDTNRTWCKLEISHAISDGGTISNLLNELARAYEGTLTSQDSAPSTGTSSPMFCPALPTRILGTGRRTSPGSSRATSQR